MRLSAPTRNALLCLAAVLAFVAAGLAQVLVPTAQASPVTPPAVSEQVSAR